MSSGRHLLLLAVIVSEIKLIRFVIQWVALVRLESLTVMSLTAHLFWYSDEPSLNCIIQPHKRCLQTSVLPCLKF